MVSVQVEGGEKLRELARRCKEAGRGDLKREMTRAIRKETAPVLNELRAAIRSTDMGVGSQSSGHTGIRDRIARAVKLKLRTGRDAGVRLEVAPMLGEAKMAKHVNKGQWRHPVYGRGGWASQQSEPGWWTNTVRAAMPELRVRVMAVFDRIAKKLDG